ncbi:cytochrome b/b6 domain-containing protein [Euzebya tangerina]|uniref:cytochrome b/b6 domain-containing protein n=1 Tax=Euzebya tangerina TaxID=591198 RepID=UPI000E30F2C5|nr:cytochrome b/b6 domain-containing protein [Euzebya tangerina]
MSAATTTPETAADPPEDAELVAVETHPRAIRWMHWINFPILAIMIWSGLRIYWAYDEFALGVGDTEIFAFFPEAFYDALGLGRRLARGIAFHFTFGWFFAINGLLYILYLAFSGEWRHIVPDRYDFADSTKVVAHDLHLTDEAPVQGKYNAAQKLAYSSVILMGALIVLTGFAIYKPTQLNLLTTLFGGYETSRLIHFWTTIGLFSFFVIHLLQVLRAGVGNFWSMISGFEYRPATAADSTDEDGVASDDEEELAR